MRLYGLRLPAGRHSHGGARVAGVPPDVFDAADACVTIPMQAGLRSLNVAVAAAMTVGEALRQIAAQDVR